MEIIMVATSITASIISGMVLFHLKRYFDRKDKKDEEKAEAEADRNILIIKSINSVGKLTLANSIALRDGKHNGEMQKALNEYNTTDKAMYEYLLRQNSNKGRNQ